MTHEYLDAQTSNENLHKVSSALTMLPHVKVSEAAIVTGCPVSVIEAIAHELDLQEYLNDDTKIDLLPHKAYKAHGIDPYYSEIREERKRRVLDHIDLIKSQPDDKQYIVRSSKTYRILGSEIHYGLRTQVRNERDEEIAKALFTIIEDMLVMHDQRTVREMGTRITNLLLNA